MNHYRAILPARHLPGKVSELWVERDVRVEDGDIVFPTQEGAAIAMFPGNWVRGGIFRAMRDRGIPVLVEVDDNYRCPPPNEELSDWRRVETDRVTHSYAAHEVIVPHMDGVIVSTPALEREYRDLHDRIYVCPNQVDPDEWDPEPEHQPGGVLRIGWAASDSHGVDAPLIEDALRWAARQDGVEVVIVGIQVWAPRCRHRYVPFAPIGEYRRNVQNIDVMLCPLKPGRWADCKSDVKALEGAMGGAVPVMSDEAPYQPWKGKPGLHARDAYEFKRHVRYLVNHRDETAQMAREAREYVLKERTIQGNVWRWAEAIEAATREAVAA